MDTTIYAAIIGGIATTAAALLSPIVSKYIDRKKKEKYTPIVSLNIKQALVGRWVGFLDQKIGKEQFLNKHKAILTIDFNSSDVHGKLEMYISDSESKRNLNPVSYLHIANVIIDGTILKMDYVNKKATVVHLGTIYGELSANGNRIIGKFLGYGLESEMLVSGNIFFEKEKSL